MYKLEIELGWLGDGKLTIETHDFDIIEVLKEFVEFQEGEGWVGAWEGTAFEDLEDEAEEDEVEEEEEEEEAAV
jgi:hypothetical protein